MSRVVFRSHADEPALSAHLIRERIVEAEARHRALDARLQELGKRAYLLPREQVEASELKKHKLKAKDEIATLRRLV